MDPVLKQTCVQWLSQAMRHAEIDYDYNKLVDWAHECKVAYHRESDASEKAFLFNLSMCIHQYIMFFEAQDDVDVITTE